MACSYFALPVFLGQGLSGTSGDKGPAGPQVRVRLNWSVCALKMEIKSYASSTCGLWTYAVMSVFNHLTTSYCPIGNHIVLTTKLINKNNTGSQSNVIHVKTLKMTLKIKYTPLKKSISAVGFLI